jgi:hypothetical protein
MSKRTPTTNAGDKGNDWRAAVEREHNTGRAVDFARARERGRGREADTPEQIPARGWRDIFGGCSGLYRKIEFCPLLGAWRSSRSSLSFRGSPQAEMTLAGVGFQGAAFSERCSG